MWNIFVQKIVIRYIRPSRRKRCEFHLIECLSLERLWCRFKNIRKWVWNGISWRSPSCPKHSDSTFHETDFWIQGHLDSKQLARSNNTPFQLTVSTWMIHLLGVRCTNRKQDYFPTEILTTKTTKLYYQDNSDDFEWIFTPKHSVARAVGYQKLDKTWLRYELRWVMIYRCGTSDKIKLVHE